MAKRARKDKERVYEVTVEGLFFCMKNGKNEFEPYELTVKMNDNHKDNGFLSTFKNLIAPQIMPKKYQGYQGLYTHNLVSVVDTDNPDAVIDDPYLMSLEQIRTMIDEEELPIQLELYQTLDDLRQAVKDYDEDPDAFEAAQANRLELRKGDLEAQSDLSRLNPEMSANLNPLGAKPGELEMQGANKEKEPDSDKNSKDDGKKTDTKKEKQGDDSLDGL